VAAEIVNLRQVRKQKARTEKEQQAQENRVRFGQSKAAKRLVKSKDNLDQKRLDGALLPETSKTTCDTPDDGSR
jgi:hypothetical protein